ncbi:MAG: hypothetical protein F6K14_29480 [Symploca sp. SIO2C1]|nr:hypothetical protein [Symploca sp. SIO2C1]
MSEETFAKSSFLLPPTSSLASCLMFLESLPTGGAPPPTNERNKPNPLPSCLLPSASCLVS